MKIPTDYLTGYEKARAVDPEEGFRLHRSHARRRPRGRSGGRGPCGPPPGGGDAVHRGRNERRRRQRLKTAPASLRTFFRNAELQPDWLDYEGLRPGVRMFHRNSYTVLVAFVAGVLIEGFTTNIARSFMLTGRVRDKGVRRLGQNNRHMTEIFFPGGLDRHADGWKLSVRIRARSRTAQAPVEQVRRVGQRGLGRTDQRGPSGILDRRLFPPGC